MSKFQRWPESLDPDAPLGKTYTARIVLPAGDSLTLVAVDIVDPTSTTVIASPVTVISEEAMGTVNGVPAISFRAQGGSVGTLYVRITYETALGNGDHGTFRLIVEQR